MSAPEVVVLDYGSGNVRSACRALEHQGARVRLTADAHSVARADGLVVPGVGAFAAVMAALDRVEGPRLIRERLATGRAVFGICVGMQVMCRAGDEGGARTAGLGLVDAEVTRLPARIVPHMGWSLVRPPEGSVLFAGVESERFYFVHSYAACSATEPGLTWCDYDGDFVAAIEAGPLSATQFHPEKSASAGARVLANWLATL